MAMSNCLGDAIPVVVDALRSGRSGLATGLLGACVGAVDLETAFDNAGFARVTGGDARLLRLALRALVPVQPALTAACRRWGRDRVAMVVGTSTAGMDCTEHAYAHLCQHGALPDGYDLHRHHAFAALTDGLAAAGDVGGPRYVISTACTSSAHAFCSAARLLHGEVADAVLVGGVDTLCGMTLRGFASLGILSAQPCRPFGAGREGINIGEGAAFVLLEKEGDAAVGFYGGGQTSDAHHMSAPHPEGIGVASAMGQALQRAGLDTSQIDYVNAHGTGTKLNDSAEALAIEKVLGNGVAVSSTKGLTGHLLGASGATEAVFSALAIEHGFLPPSRGSTPQDPSIRLNVVAQTRFQRVRFVLSNTCAFGGNNASLVFGAMS